MFLNRQINRIAAKQALRTFEDSIGPSERWRRMQKGPGILAKLYINLVAPWFYRLFTGPLERWRMASLTRYLREHGLMFDDLMSDREPIVERALTLLPEDIATGRYRRIMRGMHINMLRLTLPLHEQNYDPFVPYLAPYIEEAKFQIQEEEELLGYHPQDRRLFCGGTTGFGDLEPGMHFLTCMPNLYGAAIGNIKKH